jgi:hypothetical protein
VTHDGALARKGYYEPEVATNFGEYLPRLAEGVVPFAGIGATRLDRSPTATDGQSVASGGIGFRYELARKFGLHAGVDFAHSPGTNAIYLQIGNAWFRP